MIQIIRGFVVRFCFKVTLDRISMLTKVSLCVFVPPSGIIKRVESDDLWDQANTHFITVNQTRWVKAIQGFNRAEKIQNYFHDRERVNQFEIGMIWAFLLLFKRKCARHSYLSVVIDQYLMKVHPTKDKSIN